MRLTSPSIVMPISKWVAFGQVCRRYAAPSRKPIPLDTAIGERPEEVNVFRPIRFVPAVAASISLLCFGAASAHATWRLYASGDFGYSIGKQKVKGNAEVGQPVCEAGSEPVEANRPGGPFAHPPREPPKSVGGVREAVDQGVLASSQQDRGVDRLLVRIQTDMRGIVRHDRFLSHAALLISVSNPWKKGRTAPYSSMLRARWLRDGAGHSTGSSPDYS
jgi:hypothetical protein